MFKQLSFCVVLKTFQEACQKSDAKLQKLSEKRKLFCEISANYTKKKTLASSLLTKVANVFLL